MDSTAAAYLKILNPRSLLLSSFICFSCQGQLWLNTWHSTRRPSLRFGPIFWKYSIETLLQWVWQYATILSDSASWAPNLMSFDFVIPLYGLQPSLSLQAFWHTWHTLQLPFGSPKTRAVGRSCWVSAKNLTSRSIARALCFWSSNVCPGQLIHCSESQIPRLFPQSNWMRSC